MGTLRTLLAIAVVFAHTPLVYAFVGGRLAVQVFYCISGFLIAYILNNVTAYRSKKRFYENRALRLYPVYWAVCILTLCSLCLASGLGYSLGNWHRFAELPAAARSVLIAANFLLIGQDWVMFMGITNHHLTLVGNFMKSDPQLRTFLLAPQAWTLGVELSFYALAPFIVRRVRIVVVLFALSWLARGTGMINGLSADPWTYRFFPFELGLFLLGVLSYHAYSHFSLLKIVCSKKNAQTAFYFVTILGTVTFAWIPVSGLSRVLLSGAFLLWMFAAMPFLFHFQQTHRFDSWVGDLSFPIYIGHYLTVSALHAIRGWGSAHIEPLFGNDMSFSIVCAIASCAFAVVLKLSIADPFENLRKRLKTLPNALAAQIGTSASA
jgi:peptidoglycan/LPS O-acetylase OafA/YrhL